jgi:glycosyltransferase involved in cell wall biosynthesis
MNYRNPLVTVIITNYNYGCYVEDAIESALHQTYCPVEVIVVDDGSVDNSVEIIQQYPLRLISRAHEGFAATVDAGVHASHGEYFVILSADDILHPEYVERAMLLLTKNPQAAFVYTACYLFGGISAVLKSRNYDKRDLLRINYIPGTSLVSKRAYVAAGGYSAELPMLEDWDCWLSFAEKGFYGVYLPAALFYYRRHRHQRNLGRERKLTAKSFHVLLWTIEKITKKHRNLAPRYFLLVKLHYLAYRILRNRLPTSVLNWASGMTLVNPELSSPRFEFLDKRCCKLRSR